MRTCDARDTSTDAVLVRDGRVAALGDDAGAGGRGARRLDLDGAVVLPGFIDTHPHLMHFGVFAEPLADLRDARDHEDIRERIAAKARSTPPGEWVMATPVGEPHYFQRRSWRDRRRASCPTAPCSTPRHRRTPCCFRLGRRSRPTRAC